MNKPPAEKRVLAWDGKRWVRAIWVAKHTKEQDTDSDWHDYNDADDTYYWPEGWYEVQTHGGEEMCWHITDGVQEWREMPPAPGASDHAPDAGKMVDSEQELRDEIARLRCDLENATESRKLAQQALYDARERFQKEVLQRTAEVSRLLKQRQDCEPVHQWRKAGTGCPEWHDGHPDQTDGGGPYETRTLYAAPPKREPLSRQQIESLPVWSRFVGLWPEMREAITRAIEGAHQIGGQS